MELKTEYVTACPTKDRTGWVRLYAFDQLENAIARAMVSGLRSLAADTAKERRESLDYAVLEDGKPVYLISVHYK